MSLQRAGALLGILTEKPNFLINTALSDFLSEYFLCEALANKLIEYWEVDVPPNNAKPSKIIKCLSGGSENEFHTTQRNKKSSFKILDVGRLKRALIHFSLDFSQVSADAVFKSGKGIVHKRTARQLRNAYAHSLSVSARDEIAERITELMGSMSKFNSVISGMANE